MTSLTLIPFKEPDPNDPKAQKPSEVHRIRWRNYQALWARHQDEEERAGMPPKGDLMRFGLRCIEPIERHYMSHVHCQRKYIGHDIARRMEKGFGLPEGWMDVDHAGGTVVMDAGAREFAAVAMRLYLRDPARARAVVRELAREILGDGADGQHGL